MKKNKIPVIAFDGNHRSGKGTQINMLDLRLRDYGITPYILRGDGSRTGEGRDKNDPESEWWKNFKDYAKNSENEYEAWRIGARKLLAEAAIKYSSVSSIENSVILLDRSRISRMQMTIKEGLDPTEENMYGETLNSDIKPDLIFFLDTSIDILCKRLDNKDLKFEFRKNNIINSNKHYKKSANIIKNNNENIIVINANQNPIKIGKIVLDAIINQNILNRKDITK